MYQGVVRVLLDGMKRLAALALLVGAVFVAAPPATAGPAPVVARMTVVARVNAWPGLRAVVDGWRRSRYVDIKIAGACRSHTYCVYVEVDDYGQTPWSGETVPLGATVSVTHLNTAIPSDDAQKSAVWCHELGHSLGIAHPDAGEVEADQWGCIAGARSTPTPSRADSAQVGALAGDGVPAQGVPQGWGAMYVLDRVGR
jgi:hypothetical protein